MREKHDYLTTETEETLDGNVKAVAFGLDKSKEAVYQILRHEAPDPFAWFRAFAKGVAKGRVSLRHYIETLQAFEQKYVTGGKVRDAGEAFSDKFHGQSQLFEEYLASIRDGKIDAAECERLLELIAIEQPLTETLRLTLLVHKAKLEKESER